MDLTLNHNSILIGAFKNSSDTQLAHYESSDKIDSILYFIFRTISKRSQPFDEEIQHFLKFSESKITYAAYNMSFIRLMMKFTTNVIIVKLSNIMNTCSNEKISQSIL